MRGWLLAGALVASGTANADIADVEHVHNYAAQIYHCAWTADEVFREVIVTCSSLDWMMIGGDILKSTFDDERPGYWRYSVTVDGAPLAAGIGCSYDTAIIDGDPRGVLLRCL
jgi:hypothetical protein